MTSDAPARTVQSRQTQDLRPSRPVRMSGRFRLSLIQRARTAPRRCYAISGADCSFGVPCGELPFPIILQSYVLRAVHSISRIDRWRERCVLTRALNRLGLSIRAASNSWIRPSLCDNVPFVILYVMTSVCPIPVAPSRDIGPSRASPRLRERSNLKQHTEMMHWI
jgi:hypothetical protein